VEGAIVDGAVATTGGDIVLVVVVELLVSAGNEAQAVGGVAERRFHHHDGSWVDLDDKQARQLCAEVGDRRRRASSDVDPCAHANGSCRDRLAEHRVVVRVHVRSTCRRDEVAPQRRRDQLTVAGFEAEPDLETLDERPVYLFELDSDLTEPCVSCATEGFCFAGDHDVIGRARPCECPRADEGSSQDCSKRQEHGSTALEH
jgi:hypothetical protein